LRVYVAAYPNMAAVVVGIHARLIARGHTPTASWPTTTTTLQQDATELAGSDILVILMRDNPLQDDSPSARAAAAYAKGLTLAAGVVVLVSESDVLAAIQAGAAAIRALEQSIDWLDLIAQAKGLQQVKVG
jgi:hypothetical protein